MKSEQEVKAAFETIKQAMEEDPGYAHSWHCNIAMCFDDEFHQTNSDDANEIANDAASRFMKLCFGVETRKSGPIDVEPKPCTGGCKECQKTM